MQHHPTHLRNVGPRAMIAVLALATMGLAAGPASAAPGDPTIPDPQIVHAHATIAPAQGPPGTAISVTLTFTPVGACPGWSAVVLRTAPWGSPGSAVVSFDFADTQPDGSKVGIVHVPQTAVPGTVYYADGGCFAGPVISPPLPFLVTAPQVRAR